MNFKIFYVLIIFSFFNTFTQGNNTWYISNKNGNDKNSGLSITSPKKTTSFINSITLQAGDSILFERGNSWNLATGFTLKNSGNKSSGIYFGSYGNSSESKPILNANGLPYIFNLKKDVSYITFNELYMKDINWVSITISGIPRGWIAGNNDPCNRNSFIIIENCEFSNSKYHLDDNDLAGIYLKGPHDLKIINNYFHDIWGCPIQTMSNSSSSIHEDVYNYYVIRNKFINILGSKARIIRMRYLNPFDGLKNTSQGYEGLYHHVEIDSNYFYKIGNTCVYDEQEEQWWLQEKLGYAINVIGNEFHQVANVAIDISSVRDRYNGGWMYWSGNKIDSAGYDSLGKLTMSDPTNAIQTHGAHQLVIENNQINYVQSSSGDGNGIIIDHAIRLTTSNPPGTGIAYTCDTVIVRNNFITNCWRSANDKASGINIFKGKRTWVYNNIIDHCQVGYKVEVTDETNYNKVFNNIWNGCSVYGVLYSSTSSQNYFTNNIVSNNAVGAYMSTSNSGKLDYNQWYNNSKFYQWSSPTGSNDITSSPNFENIDNANFRPTSLSGGINKGLSYNAILLPNGEYPNTDYDKNKRTTSGNWDIGPFQYNSSTNSYVTINIKVFLEGAESVSSSYNNNVPLISPYSDATSVKSIPANIIDWIYIELRTGKASNTIIGKRSAFLRNDGQIVGLDGVSSVKLNNIFAGKYYIVIKHRNHLCIMSSSPVALSDKSELYDFTSDEGKAYGIDAMAKLDNGSYGMYTGDGDGNGVINILDYEKVSNFIFNVGYNAGDFDMNSIVNVMDYKLISTNLFKSAKVPN